MSDTFLNVLTRHAYMLDDLGVDTEVADYAIEIPLGEVDVPQFVITDDCDWGTLLVEHLRPFVIQAREHNDEDVSVGAFMNFRNQCAYLCFKQIYVGDVEYLTMAQLKDSGDLDTLPAAVRDKLEALVLHFHEAVHEGVRAAQGSYAWLPDNYRRFADFYDDGSYADWEDVHWFAYDPVPALEGWLSEQAFARRVRWARHPCNGALVVAFESPRDAESFQSTWRGQL